MLAANAPGFATLSIRPRFVWGPGDQTILPVLEAMVRSGRFVWIDGGRAQTSTTHIANLVHAVGLALERGTRRQRVLRDRRRRDARCANSSRRCWRRVGVTPPDKTIPGWLARALATVDGNDVARAWTRLPIRR